MGSSGTKCLCEDDGSQSSESVPAPPELEPTSPPGVPPPRYQVGQMVYYSGCGSPATVTKVECIGKEWSYDLKMLDVGQAPRLFVDEKQISPVDCNTGGSTEAGPGVSVKQDQGGSWFGSSKVETDPEELKGKFGSAAEDPDFHALAQIVHKAEKASEQGRLAEIRMESPGKVWFKDNAADATARADAIAKAKARIAQASLMSPKSKKSSNSLSPAK